METILVTGGSGFLAAHLLRELNASDQAVYMIEKIKLVDLKPFKRPFDYEQRIPIETYMADCANKDEMLPLFDGVTVVFHLAAQRFSMIEEVDPNLYQRNNVDATLTVLECVKQHGIGRIVHVSDALAGIPGGDQFGNCEHVVLESTNVYLFPKPTNKTDCVLGEYGRTKRQAEKMLLAAAADSPHLSVISMRPTFLYGEADSTWTKEMLDRCERFGMFIEVGQRRDSLWQWMYAGNAATAILSAWMVQKSDPTLIDGEIMHISDNEACKNYHDMMAPFARAAGYNKTKCLNYELTLLISMMAHLIKPALAWLGQSSAALNGFTRYNLNMISAWSYSFNCTKSRLLLDYKPCYTEDEAVTRSVDWWRQTTNNNRQ